MEESEVKIETFMRDVRGSALALRPPSHVLAVAYVTAPGGLDDTFAILKSHPNAPVRYSWVSQRFGRVDLYSVLDGIDDEGDPEVLALRWNITPSDAPRGVDEMGRRAFSLTSADPSALHPLWRPQRPVIDA